MERQTLVQTLIEERKRQRITQKKLAARMQTKQSTLARMEQGQRDPRLSTLQRYASSLASSGSLSMRKSITCKLPS